MAVLIKPKGEPNGTGFFVTSDGYILTCYHVIRPAIRDSSIIPIESQQEPLEAELIEDLSSRDDSLDFAVLKVLGQADRKFPCLPLGTEVGQGDPWCTLGFELTEQYHGVPNDGTIKGYATRSDDRLMRDVILKSDNPLLGGLSGSPVFNKRIGRVVGVIKEEMVRSQGHATSMESVFRIWPELEHLNSQSELLIHFEEQKDSSAKKGIRIPYPRNMNFTGRGTQLVALQATLQSAHATSLTGLGGIGKTQLALEYSYRHQDDYDIIWWLRSELPSTLLDDYALMAASLKLPGRDSGDLNKMAQAAKSFLETHSRWLLVFDNAQGPEGLKPYLPHGGEGHVIITSRNPIWGNLARPLEVLKFERSESIEFLCKRAGQQDQDAADKLADALGDLPLALEQAGAYMETTGKPLGEYLKAFQERKLKLLAKGRPSDYPHNVATTWDISFQAIQNDCPIASELLQFFSYLAPDKIPIRYLIEGLKMLRYSEAQILRDEDGWDVVLAALRSYSLISRSGDEISVHRLVQAVTRDNLTLQEQRDLAGAAVNLLDSMFPRNYLDNVKSRMVCSDLQTHALAAAGYAEKLGVELEITGKLLNECGVYLKTHGEFSDARSAFEGALRIYEQIFSPEHHKVAIVVNNLGSVLQELGELQQARQYYQKAMVIDEQIYGPEHPEVAIRVNNLGSVLRDLGELQEARKYLERALEIDEKFYGPGHPNVAIRVNNLGSVLRDLGDLQEARKYLERALEIDEKAYGPDHPNVATDLNGLGVVLKDIGDLQKAGKCLKRALEIDEKFYGPEHPNVALYVNNLGSILQDLGELQEARKCFERALKIFRECFGEDHPTTKNTMDHLNSIGRN